MALPFFICSGEIRLEFGSQEDRDKFIRDSNEAIKSIASARAIWSAEPYANYHASINVHTSSLTSLLFKFLADYLASN